MGKGEIVVLDPQLLTEISEYIVVELLSIIRDEDPGDFEAAHDAFPNEAPNILFYDSGQRFYLDLLGEVVNPYNKKLELLYFHGEVSHYIKPLLSEWAKSVHWGKQFRWLSYDVPKALALIAHLHVGLSVLLHNGPIVPCLHEFVNQRPCP